MPLNPYSTPSPCKCQYDHVEGLSVGSANSSSRFLGVMVRVANLFHPLVPGPTYSSYYGHKPYSGHDSVLVTYHESYIPTPRSVVPKRTSHRNLY